VTPASHRRRGAGHRCGRGQGHRGRKHREGGLTSEAGGGANEAQRRGRGHLEVGGANETGGRVKEAGPLGRRPDQ